MDKTKMKSLIALAGMLGIGGMRDEIGPNMRRPPKRHTTKSKSHRHRSPQGLKRRAKNQISRKSRMRNK